MASGEGPSAKALNERVRRWPAFQDELVDFAVAWSVIRTMQRCDLRRQLRAAAGDTAKLAEIVSGWKWSAPIS